MFLLVIYFSFLWKNLFLCVYMSTWMYLCALCAWLVSMEAKRKYQISLNWSYRWLLSAMCVLGTESRFSRRAASVLFTLSENKCNSQASTYLFFNYIIYLLCVYEHRCVGVHAEAKSQCLLYCTPPYAWDEGLSADLGFTTGARVPGQQAPGTHPQCWGYSHVLKFSFYLPCSGGALHAFNPTLR